MPDDNQPASVRLNDAISGDRGEQLANDLLHQKSRAAITRVVEDYVDSSAFERRIEKIIKRSLERESIQVKLSGWFNRNFDVAMTRRGWQNKTFWVPTVIAAVAAIAAIIALFK